MSGAPWEDRRGIFQKGKEVHEPGRRLSQSGSGGAAGVIDAVRRASTSSTDGAGSPMDKVTGGGDNPGSTSPTSQRRRSSGSGALFGSLQQQKRGSQDYNTRRADHADQNASGGMLSGWFNSTFKGMQNPKASAAAQNTDTK